MRCSSGASPLVFLSGLPGRDQPPDPVELEPLQREQAGAEMRLVRRIEGAAEQADPHAGRVGGKNALGAGGSLRGHGRI